MMCLGHCPARSGYSNFCFLYVSSKTDAATIPADGTGGDDSHTEPPGLLGRYLLSMRGSWDKGVLSTRGKPGSAGSE